ncbi:MAG: 1,9-bis(guanidino)-5-aza-nonane synthase [Methyloligellaceae bacterium]
MEQRKSRKDALLKETVEHVDMTCFDARPIIDSMAHMSFSARELARGAEIYNLMLADHTCSIILTLAGSTSAAGCMWLYADLVKYNMVDAIVATGASIVDMDFFEALGYRHYQGSAGADDRELRRLSIDRIYDTYIDEDELQVCDRTIAGIANGLEPRPYSSREFIHEMGRWLTKNAKKPDSLVQRAFEQNVPIFCPAFTDSSAGFGLVLHQARNREDHITIDSIADFRELTELKVRAGTTGLLMVGGGTPKNFAQDTVVCAEILGTEVDMHKYAVQVTVADPRDGGCSGSTLKEASSWGKVDTIHEQMVYGEATSFMPLIASDAYHRGHWRERPRRRWSRMFG